MSDYYWTRPTDRKGCAWFLLAAGLGAVLAIVARTCLGG